MYRFNPANLAKVRPRRWLVSAVVLAGAVPALFYLNFGDVGTFGWGFTVFLVAYCAVAAVGSAFARKPEYHTPVAAKGDALDWIGAFWLVACTFGPFFGWLVTSNAWQLTETNWRWRFGLRVTLCIVLPVVTALPLTRYARGRSALVAIPLLVGVTALPALCGFWTARDIAAGPVTRRAEIVETDSGRRTLRAVDGPPFDADLGDDDAGTTGSIVDVTFLPHTGRVLALARAPR
jgi:hypothetical protein